MQASANFKATTMKKYVSLVLLFINTMNVVIAMRTYTEGYCWRDFQGVIPADALPAGFHKDGKPIYIGQVLFEDKLIPGEIFENDNNIYFEMGEKARIKNESIKILCTDQPQNFEWIPTDIYGVSRLNDELLIRGGHETGCLTYIGRRNADRSTDRKTYVGKIICNTDRCLALYTTNEGNEVEFHSFEILSYSPVNDNIINMV